jgi:hypothetical protein
MLNNFFSFLKNYFIDESLVIEYNNYSFYIYIDLKTGMIKYKENLFDEGITLKLEESNIFNIYFSYKKKFLLYSYEKIALNLEYDTFIQNNELYIRMPNFRSIFIILTVNSKLNIETHLGKF